MGYSQFTYSYIVMDEFEFRNFKKVYTGKIVMDYLRHGLIGVWVAW